jgi:ATP diphosphatase
VDKLIRRHPHVFGDVRAQTPEEALASWSKQKAEEKRAKRDTEGKASTGHKRALDGIPRSAPALLGATRSGEKAGATGFDWPDATGPRGKIDEELEELDQAVATGKRADIVHELGDVLFAVANLARKLGVDAESALRQSSDRFARRYAHMEDALRAENRTVRDASPEECDRRWEAAKQALKA